MDIVARDVVGTAHSNAAVANRYLARWLGGIRRPELDELKEVEELLVKAISDVSLARHMLSSDWGEDTTYVGTWDRPIEMGDSNED